MINYEKLLTEEQRSLVQEIISGMGIEKKPTINEFLNDLREMAIKHRLIEIDEAAPMEVDIA